MRQGDPADELYIVISGRFAVTLEGRRDAAHRDRPRAADRRDRLPHRGDAHGNRDGHARQPRAAPRPRRVRALSAKCPSIWRTLTDTLSHRLAATTAHRAAAARSAPAHHRAHPRRRQRRCRPNSSRQLAPMIRGATPTRSCSTRPSAATLLPKGVALDSTEATQRAQRSSRARTTICIFIADAELTPWSQKAIRHADLVLAVGVHDGADPTPNALEQLAAAFVTTEARSASSSCTNARDPSRARRAGCAAAASPCTTTWRSNDRRHIRGSTASSTARRSASSPAAAGRCAPRTSGSTRR